MAFAKRIVDLQFHLSQGDFGNGADTVDLKGLRVSANIVKQGIGFAQADIQVWGMPLDMMNRLTVLNKVRYEQQRYNTVVISAGDEKSGVSTCFGGVMREAWADGRQPPDVAFHVSADSALYETLKPIPPTSFKGSVDAATVLAGLAQQMGYSFENSGVTAQITNPYWPGSIKDQLLKVCDVAHCDHFEDAANKVLAVWPKGQARNGAVVKVSADTGLVGYPAFTQGGVQVTTLYNPSLEFGRLIEVESQFAPANGQWRVYGLAHRLESNVPGGQWFSDIECLFLDHTA